MATSYLQNLNTAFLSTRALTSNSGINLDDLYKATDGGMYNVGANVPGTPENSSWGMLIVFVMDGSFAGQLFFAGMNLYFRTRVGNPLAWLSWRKLTGTAI